MRYHLLVVHDISDGGTVKIGTFDREQILDQLTVLTGQISTMTTPLATETYGSSGAIKVTQQAGEVPSYKGKRIHAIIVNPLVMDRDSVEEGARRAKKTQA